MSYALAVWEGPRPVNNEAALKTFKERIARIEAAGPDAPTPAIAEYVDALLRRWPDITDEAGEGSPWSDGPLIQNASGDSFYFGIVFSMADEASEFAAQLAQEQGLVCFDPQEGLLRPPTGPADGQAADVSIGTVSCALCGNEIAANEPRAEEPGTDGFMHLACMFGSPPR